MPIKIGVIGVGHLGKHHARLLGENPRAELVAIADTNEEVVSRAEAAYGVPGYRDHTELEGKVDAVCVVVPTTHHCKVGQFFLERGVDVFVEKPIALTAREGQELVDAAERHQRILQVGHVERFNPAMKAIEKLGLQPRYIETHRLGGITFRSMDIGVVLDLMIHDLDLVLALVGSPVASVDAFGGALFTKAEDIASAVIKFENGAVAHLTANRVALTPMRRMRIFSKVAYASLDFNQGQGVVIRKNPGWNLQELDLDSIDPAKIDDLWKFVFEGLLRVERYSLDEGNPLAEELDAFLHSVASRERPLVSGEDGVAAVAVAEKVLSAIQDHSW